MQSSDLISSNDARMVDGFSSFGFRSDAVYRMMADTSITIGGGFLAGYFLGYLDPSSDIDFYVHGGVAKQRDSTMTEEVYFAQKHREDTFYRLVLRQFREFVTESGYEEQALPEGTYGDEITSAGTRLFTTGSNVRMRIHYFKATINGLEKTLNLIFTDKPIPEVMRSVDISVCACYMWATSPTMIGYYHAHPFDVENRLLSWVEPDSTHTPRQIARWNKYTVRYGLRETRALTVAQFLETYDSLADNGIYVLRGTIAEFSSTPVVRRIRGMPAARFITMNA
jgi:hypothetical protein